MFCYLLELPVHDYNLNHLYLYLEIQVCSLTLLFMIALWIALIFLIAMKLQWNDMKNDLIFMDPLISLRRQ